MVTALKSDNLRQLRPRSRQNAASLRGISSRESGVASSTVPAAIEERSSLRSQATQPQTSPSPTIVDPKVVTALPRTQGIPGWLNLLVKTHRASLMLTFLLVGAVLAAYGWTVVIQQQWGREYRRLETLQKHERQLVAGNEAIKNQMAEQAESPTSGLMVPDPNNAFFLAPAPNRPPAEPPHHPTSQPAPAKPLGY
ncbi:hypothetical protein [Egbenema bharatensis]|uniref:hypothetical protein n=1 Tax=Egbenema bharatensis TaxID=3463334 RepID=UPI003A8C151C